MYINVGTPYDVLIVKKELLLCVLYISILDSIKKHLNVVSVNSTTDLTKNWWGIYPPKEKI